MLEGTECGARIRSKVETNANSFFAASRTTPIRGREPAWDAGARILRRALAEKQTTEGAEKSFNSGRNF
jgi:hypothetical protein